MKPTAVYHWWSLPNEPPVYENLRTPIIASIASLRAVSDVPIVVLDLSDFNVDWGYFPQKLNFEVIKHKPKLTPYQNLVEGWRHLSRIPDLYAWAQNDVLYVDSDIFFFQDPFPLSCVTDKFCWDGWNTGFFYFNPNAKLCQEFYEIFDSYCMSAIHSQEIRKLMKSYLQYDSWYGVWDEMILSFFKFEHSHLFNYIPLQEHTTARVLAQCPKPKVFHANGSLVSNPLTHEVNARGLLPIMISEFFNNVIKVLSTSDLMKMYGQLLTHFENQKISLLENANKLEGCKDQNGHYHLNFLFKNIKMI